MTTSNHKVEMMNHRKDPREVQINRPKSSKGDCSSLPKIIPNQ